MTLPSIFESAPIQLWTAHKNGALSYVNDVVLSYFGRRYEQMIEWGWAECVHDDDLPVVGEKWSESLETGTEYLVRFRLRRHDGAYLWHVARAQVRRDAAGAVESWAGANMCIDDLPKV